MASTPRPRSLAQIQGEMLDQLAYDLGISRLKIAGPLLSIVEAASRSDSQSIRAIMDAVLSRSIDSADEASLAAIGRDEETPRLLASKAVGRITVGDGSFVKKSSVVSTAGAAPIIGTTDLRIDDATGWPLTGQVYIGRRTTNVEGPLSYTSITDNGSYTSLTLSTPTTKFHNYGESVVLAQGGDRTIGKGQVVQTPQSTLTSAVSFVVLYDYILEDGENVLEGVQVLAQKPGTDGNIPHNTLTVFSPTPFNGATASNPKKFVTGRDLETVDDYRQRLKSVLGNRQGGTDLAIENSVVGLISPDEDSRIISASLVRKPGSYDILYIDDGNGYEEIPAGVGVEILADRAVGGETDFQVNSRPIAKARIESTNRAPFVLSDSDTLSVEVGGVTTTHIFDSSDFRSIKAASAYEIVASINADESLNWGATTAGAGTAVVITARAETNDDVVVRGGSAQAALLLSDTHNYTTFLFKNDRLLSKDGRDAVIRSRPFSQWNAFSGTSTLYLNIDQTPEIYWIFTNQDFIDANTGYATVAKNSVQAWATVINAKIPGIVATVEDDVLVLTSNRSRSGASRLSVNGGTLVSDLMFATQVSEGASSDYTIDRATGQIYLTEPLSPGDRLSLGSSVTRAFLESGQISASTFSSEAVFWLAVDGTSSIVSHGVGTSTLMTASIQDVVEHGFKLGIEAASTFEAFKNVRPGDIAVFYDPATTLPDSLRTAWRVNEVLDVGGLANKIVVEKAAMRVPRTVAASCVLTASGSSLSEVFICGGYTVDDDYGIGAKNVNSRTGYGVTSTAEIFDPNTGAWRLVSEMQIPRARHTASLLADGRVLVVGGVSSDGLALDSSEIYDPSNDTWAIGPTLATARSDHSATVLASGRVLIAGGVNTSATSNSVEYNPGTNTFINSATMPGARYAHVAVLLGPASAQPDRVLVAGGFSAVTPTTTTTAALYNPGTSTWTATGSMSRAHTNCGIGTLADNHILVGGDRRGGNISYYQVYNVSTGLWLTEQQFPSNFVFENQPFATTPNKTIVAAYGRINNGGGGTDVTAHYKITHDVTTPETPNFVALPASKFRGLQKGGSAVLALQSASAVQRVVICGGTSVSNLDPTALQKGLTTAHHELIDVSTNTWSWPDPSLEFSSDTLGSRGLAILRSDAYLQKITIPAAAGYTAPTLAEAINSDLRGAVASVFRTTRLRIRANAHSDSDIIMVASEVLGPLSGLSESISFADTSDSVETSHRAVAVSSNQIVPSKFCVYDLVYSAAPDVVTNSETVFLDESGTKEAEPPGPSGEIVALRRTDSGLNPYYWSDTFSSGDPRESDLRTSEWGNAQRGRFAIGSYAEIASAGIGAFPRTDIIRAGIRQSPSTPFVARTPVVVDRPLHLSATDTLSVDIDGSTFAVATARRCATSGSYGSTLTLSDADLAQPLAKAFGINYDWKDFAVLMRSRVLSNAGSAIQRILWRWKEPGPNGDSNTIRYVYPDSENQAVSLRVVDIQGATTPTTVDEQITSNGGPPSVSVHIGLSSGDVKDDHILRPTTRLGLCTNSITSGRGTHWVFCGFKVIQGQRTGTGSLGNRIRLQIPNWGTSGPTSTGVTIGMRLWFEATIPSPSTLFSGIIDVTHVDAATLGYQDIYFSGLQLNGGGTYGPTADVGTVSFDTLGETRFDQTLVNGDFIRLDSSHGLPAEYCDKTMRVAESGPQFIRAIGLDIANLGSLPTPLFYTLTDVSDLKTFGRSTETAASLAAAVNAIPYSPVSATVTGSGTGDIWLASWDEFGSTDGYILKDGINWVESTIDPLTDATNTQFVMRMPTDSGLVTDADWSNEEVWLQPVLVSDMVQWMRTPAVSGLSTVAEIDLTAANQIAIASKTISGAATVQIVGGDANSSTASILGSATLIDRPDDLRDGFVVVSAENPGFQRGAVVRLQNSTGLPKTAWYDASTQITSITASGVVTFSLTPYITEADVNDLRITIEKVGDLVAVRIPYQANVSIPEAALAEADFREGAYIFLRGPDSGSETTYLPLIADANRGVFRVLKTTRSQTATTVWIQNSNVVEESCVCRMAQLASNSPVPGDVLVLNTTKFGTQNRGEWTITDVGAGYTNDTITLDVSTKTPQTLSTPISFGTDLAKINIRSTPDIFLKEVLTSYTASDGYTRIHFLDSAGYDRIGAAGGTICYGLGKLGFGTDLSRGVDGYSYSTGLIAEANRVIYGDQKNASVYKGVAASGASILFSGPLVKRVGLGLSLRVQSGAASQDLADRARSAAASVVAEAGVGVSVAFSEIIDAVQKIPGIVAVSITFPSYSSTQDLIEVSSSEKAMVLDLADISVVFVGE